MTGNKLPKLDDIMMRYPSTLKTMRLDSNRLSSFHRETFSGQTTVDVLSISDNKLERVKARVLAELINLYPLNLADNKISSGGCFMVCDLVSKCDTITELHLQNNQICNEGGEQLVNAIQQRKLTKLDIDNNNISGGPLASLLMVVPVTKLNLVRNRLSDAQVDPMRQNMIEKRDLKVLFMSHNRLSDRALGMLAEGIAVNIGLEEI